MNKIEVAVIGEYGNPGQMAAFLARLTQRGHKIKNMEDLEALFNRDHSSAFIEALAGLKHGTVKRFTPITVAIVGASRRFLAQARTNQVGFNYVSASLQYSDYTGSAQFVVPYALMEADHNMSQGLLDQAATGQMLIADLPGVSLVDKYLNSCEDAMLTYESIAKLTDNDTAGYAAPQGLRNILIMQGNHQSWDYFIRTRICNRNTVETQYVTALIWDALLQTVDGQEFFGKSGADCAYGPCREGKFCCGNPMRKYVEESRVSNITVPRAIINDKWPLLKGVNTK